MQDAVQIIYSFQYYYIKTYRYAAAALWFILTDLALYNKRLPTLNMVQIFHFIDWRANNV